jgi:hypothetical protein
MTSDVKFSERLLSGVNARPDRSDVSQTNRDNAAADLAAAQAVVTAAKTGMTSAAAQKRLEEMTSDVKFSERLLSGDPKAITEFNEISAIAVSADREDHQVAEGVHVRCLLISKLPIRAPTSLTTRTHTAWSGCADP